VNFYFEYHKNLAFTLKYFNLPKRTVGLHNTNISAMNDWYYAAKNEPHSKPKGRLSMSFHHPK